MTDFDDCHLLRRVVNFVSDAIIADSYAPQLIFASDFDAPGGSSASARADLRTRFLIVLSSRFNSRSAREVMITLYINFTFGTHLGDNFRERTTRFIFTFLGDAA